MHMSMVWRACRMCLVISYVGLMSIDVAMSTPPEFFSRSSSVGRSERRKT